MYGELPRAIESFLDCLSIRQQDLSLLSGLRLSMAEYINRSAHIAVAHVSESQKPGHKVYFVLSDSGEANAFAATVEGHDIVVIHMGLIERIIDLVLRYKVIRTVRSVSLALPKAARVAESLIYNEQDRQLCDLMTIVCLSLCVDFVYAHELGHIWCGHTDYANKNLSLDMIQEVGVKLDLSETNVLQALEMDADCFAAGMIVNSALGNRYLKECSSRIVRLFGLDGLRENRNVGFYVSLYAAAFSINTFFHLIEEFNNPRADLNSTHPPASFRFGWSIGILLDYYRLYAGAQSVNVTAVNKAKLYSDVFYCVSRSKEIVSINPWAFESKEMEDYNSTIYIKWGEVRPKLDVLKRGGNLAPDRSEEWKKTIQAGLYKRRPSQGFVWKRQRS